MKNVRAVALSRNAAPAYLTIYDREAVLLRTLPPWMRWLFIEIVGMTDFVTGHGKSSWAQLESLLDWDKPERGRRAAESLSAQQIRRAFAELEKLGLVERDATNNEYMGQLKFRVIPRRSKPAPTDKTDRGSDRGAVEEKQAQKSQDFRQVDQQGFNTAREAQSALTVPPPAHVAELRKTLLARRAGGTNQPPQGGENVAPTGHAPPGAAPLAARLGVPLTPNTQQPPQGGDKTPPRADLVAPVGALLEGLKNRLLSVEQVAGQSVEKRKRITPGIERAKAAAARAAESSPGARDR